MSGHDQIWPESLGTKQGVKVNQWSLGGPECRVAGVFTGRGWGKETYAKHTGREQSFISQEEKPQKKLSPLTLQNPQQISQKCPPTPLFLNYTLHQNFHETVGSSALPAKAFQGKKALQALRIVPEKSMVARKRKKNQKDSIICVSTIQFALYLCMVWNLQLNQDSFPIFIICLTHGITLF